MSHPSFTLINAGAPEAAERQDGVRPDRSARVLLVTGETALREQLTALLSERWSVIAVDDEEAALRHSLPDPEGPPALPDLVLAGGAEGAGLARALAQHPQGRAIPLISLCAGDDDEACAGPAPAEYVYLPIRANEVVARVATQLELAALRQRERAQGHTPERLGDILESISDAFLAIDRDWRIIYVNSHACAILGYPREQLLGQPFWDVVSPDIEPVASAYHKAMNQRERVTLEFEAPPSGRWYRTSLYPTPDGIVAYGLDITEQRRMAETEERFRIAQELSLDGFIVLESVRGAGGVIVDFDCVYVNPTAARMIGQEQDELVGRRLLDILPATGHGRDIFDACARVVESGAPHERELRYDEAGTTKWFRLMAVELRGGVAVFLHDITVRKHAEDVRQEEARRKDEFLAVLAHELRNPLAPIRLSVEILRRLSPQDPALERAWTIIERQVAHMVRLIDDLLDLSRISRGKILLRKERLDLVELVRLTTEDQRQTFEAERLSLETRLPAHPVWVHADATRLSQAIGNLLSNAAKFTEAGGRVRVTLEDQGHQALIRVTDTGIGMGPEMLARLFQPFTQADEARERGRGGLGLGLALVKGLVELHGGQVSARSAGAGQGSTFSIVIPCLQARPMPVAHEESQGNHRDTASTSVLLVEDNIDAAEMLASFLSIVGHQVQVAHDGPSALAAAQAQRPRVIICDIGLPGQMDGYQVARTLRERQPDTYLIALSGYGMEEDRRRAYDAGFDLHLIKPVDPPEIERLLARLSLGTRA